jgi:hypothetical protein
MALVAFGGSLFSSFHFDDYSLFDSRTWHSNGPGNVKNLQRPPGYVGNLVDLVELKISSLTASPMSSTTGFENAIYSQ